MNFGTWVYDDMKKVYTKLAYTYITPTHLLGGSIFVCI